MDYSTILDRLEREIRQYRVEYQRFFNGDLKVPPVEYAEKIRKQLNRLVAATQLSPVDRFRLSGLEGHYNSLSDLYRRRLRDMDMPHPAAVTTQRPAAKTIPTIVVGESAPKEEVGSLYEALYANRDAPVALEDFHAYVLEQANKVRQRTGCSSVRFTVRDDGGKKRLKARPLPDGRTR